MEGKVVVLVIDEGQKLTPAYIETIWTLLNLIMVNPRLCRGTPQV